jgi:hypothetical protein
MTFIRTVSKGLIQKRDKLCLYFYSSVLTIVTVVTVPYYTQGFFNRLFRQFYPMVMRGILKHMASLLILIAIPLLLPSFSSHACWSCFCAGS